MFWRSFLNEAVFLYAKLFKKNGVVIIRKKKQVVSFESTICFEQRAESAFKLVKSACEKYPFLDFESILVSTLDDPLKKRSFFKFYSYSSVDGDYRLACPDFFFDKWETVKIDDYDTLCAEIHSTSLVPAKSDKLGWIGVIHVEKRKELCELGSLHPEKMQFVGMNWNVPNNNGTLSYLSLTQQVEKWRYLIDIEGYGYSARLKALMFAHRPIFVVDRPWKEWFYAEMIPWVHYVPVKRDLSDLLENLDRVRNDVELEKSLAQNVVEFANSHLTRDHALQRWRDLINKI